MERSHGKKLVKWQSFRDEDLIFIKKIRLNLDKHSFLKHERQCYIDLFLEKIFMSSVTLREKIQQICSLPFDAFILDNVLEKAKSYDLYIVEEFKDVYEGRINCDHS